MAMSWKGDVEPKEGEMALRPGPEVGSISSGPRVRVEHGKCSPARASAEIEDVGTEFLLHSIVFCLRSN